jgi:regulator of RNase E activity RraA
VTDAKRNFMPIGFQIHKAPARPAPELVEQFRDVVTAHLSDNMSRMCGTVGLRRYNPRGKLVGTALTVRTRLGDNLMIHKALNHAEPGDVLVVDGGGDISQALVGELMMLYARTRGVVGFVIDGAIRDVAAFANSDFPCYARGDEDGVVALSPAIAPEVLAAARKQAEREEKAKADIAARRYDRSWVDAALTAKGVLKA